MSAVIDEKKYARLLAQRLPRVITSADDHARFTKDVQSMMKTGAKLSVEERELMHLMIMLIQDYETKHFNADFDQALPLDVLEHLMDAQGHTAKDLWEVIGDKGTVSKILSGERQISKEQAKRLAQFYKVSPSLFI